MELRRDLYLGVGVLFALNVLLAFTAIGLFGRMGPVIDKILRENVVSIAEAEEMLAALALAPTPGSEPQALFDAALARARANITEPQEATLVGRLHELRTAGDPEDPTTRVQMVSRLRDLLAVNRRAMREADDEARRLGLAGAWFAAFMATFTLLLGAFTVRRLGRRLVDPVGELVATLDQIRRGDVHRRLSTSQAPREFGRLFRDLNELLDVRFNPRPWTDRRARIDRAVALWAIEKEPEAVFVVDEGGRLYASNKPAHEMLGSPEGAAVREKLPRATTREGCTVKVTGDLEICSTPLQGGSAWLCRVKPPRS